MKTETLAAPVEQFTISIVARRRAARNARDGVGAVPVDGADRGGRNVAAAQIAELHRRRDSPRAAASPCSVIGFLLSVRESIHILAKKTRRVHQRRERREIAGARVQSQQIETDALERGDALAEMRRCRFAPRTQARRRPPCRTARARRARRPPRAPRPRAPRAPRRSPAARRTARGTPSAAPRTAPTRRRRARLRWRETRTRPRAPSARVRRAGARATRQACCARGAREVRVCSMLRTPSGIIGIVEDVARRAEQPPSRRAARRRATVRRLRSCTIPVSTRSERDRAPRRRRRRIRRAAAAQSRVS